MGTTLGTVRERAARRRRFSLEDDRRNGGTLTPLTGPTALGRIRPSNSVHARWRHATADGWYDGSPTPGQLGPAVLAGHVDWEGEPGASYGLRELRPGDTVVVDRADGTVATFRVDRVEEHAEDDFPTEEVHGDIDHAGQRLITRGGALDEDAGDHQADIIVFASLAGVG